MDIEHFIDDRSNVFSSTKSISKGKSLIGETQGGIPIEDMQISLQNPSDEIGMSQNPSSHNPLLHSNIHPQNSVLLHVNHRKEPLNLFPSSQECMEPYRVVWILEMPLADMLRHRRKSLYEMLEKAKKYIQYKERKLDCTLRNVMDRVKIVTMAAQSPNMTEEDLNGSMADLEVMEAWTTSLIKMWQRIG
ncbi:hypothetical protein FRX31_014702 [Thalictrum thalictroides]|uniref:Uncharacterized protein n=1 Tax=Thalictrum thalictroides TaxID=46969 RepID=A0A7J6WED2_THATH|nr:hypothetical protein FRX31_014702 [Thalictrum thalictroides]